MASSKRLARIGAVVGLVAAVLLAYTYSSAISCVDRARPAVSSCGTSWRRSTLGVPLPDEGAVILISITAVAFVAVGAALGYALARRTQLHRQRATEQSR